MRKRRAEKENYMPMAKYGDMLVSRMVNSIMLDGKKIQPEKSFMVLLILLERKQSRNLLEIFRKAI